MLRRLLSRFLASDDHFSNPDTSAKIRLELALESSGLVDWDFNYELNTAHRGIRHDELYGYKEFLPVWNFDNFFHHVLPEFHDLAKEKFANIPGTGEISFEYKIRRVDGEIRWISLKGKGERNSEGKVVRVAGVLKDITDDKNREEDWNIQSKNLESLFQNASEFLCIFNTDLVYEYVNPAHIRLFDGRNMKGEAVDIAQPELRGSEFVENLRKILITGETITYTESPVQIGTNLRYLDMMYTPRKDAMGKVNGIYALGSDVTDKILALKRAEQSAAQMKLITDMLPAFVSYTDKMGRYQFVNRMYEKWFGTPMENLLGKTRKDIAPSEYVNESRNYETLALSGKPSHHQGVIRKANGEALNLDINFVPDIDMETNEVRGMVAVGVDISAQVNALREVELARQELHELFMQAPAPMCLLTGSEFTYTMANPEYVKLVRREVQGKTLDQVFDGEDITFYRGIIEQVYTTGKPYHVKEAPLEFVDNDKFRKVFLNVGYHAYKDSTGNVKGVLVICEDVTDQVNSVTTRDNFISVASHELKTPLTALKLQIQLHQRILKDNPADLNAEKMNILFAKTESQLNRLDRLVNDMLEGSRTSAEKLEILFTRVNFSDLVIEVFQSYMPQLQSADVAVTTDIETGIFLHIDEARIEQVMVNLITNVIRYANHAPLKVILKRHETNVVLSVKDSGRGIDPKNHKIIFERFGRVNVSRDVTGLGLGLYISRKIVENHGGSLTVISDIGKGAEFCVSLPLVT